MLKQSDSRILPQARHLGMTLLVGLVLCAAVVDTQRILHTLQGNVRRDVTNQVAVIAERGYTYLTCSMDGGSIQWLFQNGTTVPVFQPFTQFHTRQGVVLDRTMQVQYLAISPFVPTDQGFYRCLSVKNGLSQEVHVGLFLVNGLVKCTRFVGSMVGSPCSLCKLAPRDVSVTNATTDGFMAHWRAPVVGVGPMDGFLVQASSQDTKQVVESVSLGVGDRDYQFICLQPNSTFTVTVSAIYGTVVRSFSPLPEVKTTAGVWPEMCSTSDSSSDIGPALAIPAPDDVTVTALPRPGAIRVTWSVPTRPLWLAITGYLVTVTDVSHQQIVKSLTKLPNVFEAEVAGLKLGSRYEAKVALVTSKGDGTFSNSSTVVTYNVPDKIMNVTTWPDVLGTEAIIRTRWLASHSDVIITHYIVKYTLGGVELNTTSTSEETVQVVKRGTLYRVAVAAVSAIGIGNFSDSAQGKSYNVPELVQATVASISPISVTLHWVVEQPMRDRLPVLHYILRHSSDHSNGSIVLPSNASMHNITGLIPGTTYNLSLLASNSLGTGPGHVQVVTTMKAPPPGRVTATPLAVLGQLYINWTYPPSELQGYSSGYLVRYRVRGTNSRHMLQSSTSNHMSTILTGLKAGTVYEVEVAYVIRHIGLYSPLVFAQTFDVPQVVTKINATAGENEGSPNIEVSWSPPYSDVPIESYIVTLWNSSGSLMHQLTVRGVVSVVIGEVESGREYLVGVMAVSVVGKGKSSQPVTVRTFNVPGTPVLLSVLPTVRDRSPALDLSWSQPHSDIALLDFVIEYWEHKLHVHSVVTNLSSITLSHLALGVAYSVRVAARSALGQGQFSAVQERSTLNVPPEVGNVSLLPSVVDQAPALNISWKPPTYSLPIAYYRVYLYTLGLSNQTIVTTNGTVVVMEMLDRGVEYEVYIIAVSILGEGRRGELHRAVTHDVPGPPGDVRKVFVQDNSVILYWCCTDQRRLAIQYVLMLWRGSKVARKFILDDPFFHVRGLDSNTQYFFSVQAVNDIGVGTDKNITVTTLPERPMQLVVIPTSSTVLEVQWLPPVNHDRVSIVYDVECTLVYDEDIEVSVTRNKTFVGLPGTNLILTSLLPYMVYVVKVTARNEEGSSAANMVQARTFSAIPSAPPLVYDVQAVSPHSATIRWDPPPWQQRNGRITSYTLSVRSSDGDVWQRNTTATWAGAQEGFVWTDLYQNGHFVVMIAATNVNGTGPFSRAKNFTTPLDVPGQPQDVRVEHTNTSAVALMWSGAKIRNNHVESYFVNYTTMDGHMEGVRGGSMVVGEPQMHCLLLGLDEYREYSVVVTGVNAMGRGAHSRYFTFRTPGKEPSGYPSVLGRPLTQSTSVQIHIAEIEYLDQNGPVTNYTLHYAPSSDVHPGDVRSASIEASGRMVFHLQELQPFTMYQFQIQGINEFGMGPFSPFAEFMTAEDVPGQPQGIQVQAVNDSCAHVRAQPPMSKNGILTDYRIEVEELESNRNSGQNVNVSFSASRPGMEYIWCGLEPEVPYEVHVSASTRVGPGPAISSVFFTREGAAPHSVSEVTVTRTSGTSVMVSWEGLTLTEARGFPLYLVLLKSKGEKSGMENITKSTTNTSAVVTDVDPATTYEVSVTVYTGAGLSHGAESAKVTLVAMPQSDGRSASILDRFLGIPHLLYYIIGGAAALAVITCLLLVLCPVCCCLRRKKKHTSGSFSPKVEEGLSLGEGVSDVEISRNACTPVERESVLCDESTTSDELGGQKGFNML